MQPLSVKKQLKVQVNDSLDKTFKQYAKTISESISKLGAFTDNLEGKVSTLLKAQQSQFVTSYKNHMAKIKDQLAQMESKLAEYQQKIDFYQNQGRLSHYIKKVNFMQGEQIKLYEEIKAKDKKIKELQFDIEMRKKLQKQSDQKIKIMYRKKIEEQEQNDRSTEKSSFLKRQTSQTNLDVTPTYKHLSSIETFTTEIPSYHYNRKAKLNLSSSKERLMTKMITDDQQKSALYKSHEYINSLEEDGLNLAKQNELKDMRILALQKSVHHLKTQNKKLLLFNSKYANNLSQLGQFFLKTVQELKKSIASKRKIKNDINFEEFSRQDKLVLIATLLSNETAIMLLYDNIFKPKPNKNRAQSVLQKSYGSHKNQESIKTERKMEEILTNPEANIPFSGKLVFPSLKSRRLIH